MKNESGRSMVEMLGVLAIIGVLSIGGIAGYTLAMNRYRANEIVNAASKLAVIAMSADAGRGQKTAFGAAGLGEIPAGLDNMVAEANGAVTITYSDASADVKNLVNDLTNSGDLTISVKQKQ